MLIESVCVELCQWIIHILMQYNPLSCVIIISFQFLPHNCKNRLNFSAIRKFHKKCSTDSIQAQIKFL